jgi:Flp pilus assembly pilin Flp
MVTIDRVPGRGRQHGGTELILLKSNGTYSTTALITIGQRTTIMKNLIARFIRDEQGQDLIEYALLGSFVSLAAYAGADLLGGAINSWYEGVGGAVDDAAAAVPVIN